MSASSYEQKQGGSRIEVSIIAAKKIVVCALDSSIACSILFCQVYCVSVNVAVFSDMFTLLHDYGNFVLSRF